MQITRFLYDARILKTMCYKMGNSYIYMTHEYPLNKTENDELQ